MRAALWMVLALSACGNNLPWAPAKDPSASFHHVPKPPKAPRADPLDESKGGPLTKVDVASLQVTQDVLTQGSSTVAGTIAECDASFGTILGQHWYTFSDAECYGGTSVSLLQLLHNGNDGLGCTLRWLGTLQSTTDPFTGLGHDLKGADLSKFKTLHLQIRGDGNRYRFQVPMQAQLTAGGEARAAAPTDAEGRPDCHREYYDFYGSEFACGDGTDVWAPLDVDLSALRQSGSGKAWAKDLSDADSLQIVTTLHAQEAFQCELRIVGVE